MEYPCAFFILVKTRPRPTVPNYKYNELQAGMYTYGTVYTVTSLNTFRSDLVPVHIINYDGKNKGKTNLKRMKRENVRTLSICCQQRICIQQYTVLGVGRKCTRQCINTEWASLRWRDSVSRDRHRPLCSAFPHHQLYILESAYSPHSYFSVVNKGWHRPLPFTWLYTCPH